MAIGDTFALEEIHAYQLAEMCDECGLPQRQVATSLNTLCSSLIKAIETFNHRQHLIGDELDFAELVLADIKARCARFRELSAELPLMKL
jgi:serine/threonine-protein kinase HipA